MRAAVLLAVVLVTLAGCGGDDDGASPPRGTTVPAETPAPVGTSGDAALAAAGAEYAERELDLEVDDDTVAVLRSRRDADWALVSGFTTGDRPWATWLRDGRVVSGSASRYDEQRAPCDIRVAFSEPDC